MPRRSTMPLLCLLLLMAALPSLGHTAEVECQADDRQWVPTRYYLRDAVVFYDGQWFRARETHEGREPREGQFTWQPLASTPSCMISDTDERAETNASKPVVQSESQSDQQPTEQTCPQLDDWSFGGSYVIGDRVQHDGQAYKAIRPSNGTLPGSGRPPEWQPVDDHCQ